MLGDFKKLTVVKWGECHGVPCFWETGHVLQTEWSPTEPVAEHNKGTEWRRVGIRGKDRWSKYTPFDILQQKLSSDNTNMWYLVAIASHIMTWL